MRVTPDADRADDSAARRTSFLACGPRRWSPGPAAGTSAYPQSRLKSSDQRPSGRLDRVHQAGLNRAGGAAATGAPRGFLMPQLCGRRPVVIGPRGLV